MAKYSDVGLDLSKGVIFASGDGLDTATLFDREQYRLDIPRAAELTVTDVCRDENGLSFTVTTDVYAHGVHFGLHESVLLSDCYFDLLPGESKRVTVKDCGIELSQIVPTCVFVENKA